MSLRFDVEHRDGYSVVRVEGEPSLGQFLSFLHLVGVETAGWKTRRVLFDLRQVQTLTTFTDHYAVGEEAARQLSHLQRVASLVEPHRITRASEKTAQRSGMNLIVFTDEEAAVAWLTA
ncbi:STAS/SEC14 domain-containing protein [Ramlibacter sp. AN1133]|uniref:STAS/SEC14 domain-containing protein n=1 Tax=Ramlibacter sp. AN1133 TaxID=3133429 RepID=UPI0030C38634